MDDQERAPEAAGAPPAAGDKGPRDGIDFSALSRGERSVLLTGGLLFLSGFVPWWFRVPVRTGPVGHDAGLTGLTTAAVTLGALAAVGVLIRAWRFPQRGPADGLAYAATGAVAAALLTAEIARDTPVSAGVYVGLVLSIGIVAAGIKRRAERKAGWI